MSKWIKMIKQEFNESFIQYLSRLTNYLDNGMITYDEWGDLILGAENVYSSDNLRKASYVLKKILPKLDGSDDIDSEEILETIKEQKEEMFKERCRLQDQRREYNKLLREEARYENLRDVLVDTIREIEPQISHTPQRNKLAYKEAILDISDIHAGLLIDNVVNYYDIDTMKDRMNVLLNKTIEYVLDHRVRKLHINLLGDLISGFIHLQSRVAAEEDVMSQIIIVSEVLSNMINELDKYVEVEVYGVVGNHSRATADKKSNMPAENFERLIFEYINLRCPKHRVHLNGLEDWQTYSVMGREIFITHGDKDTISNVKKHSVDILGRVVDEIHIGHFHHVNITDDCNTEIVVNGSAVGTDEHAMSVRKNTKPYQVLRVYGEDDDVITCKISLDK